jgi:hypothetical protein
MPKPTTPTIKIEVSKGFCFPKRVTAGLGDLQAIGNTWSAASTRLAELVRDRVTHETASYVVVCNDGTTLVGRTEAGGFTYAMTGANRDTSWTCGCGRGFDAMAQAMERHAHSCYGGVSWAKRV